MNCENTKSALTGIAGALARSLGKEFSQVAVESDTSENVVFHEAGAAPAVPFKSGLALAASSRRSRLNLTLQRMWSSTAGGAPAVPVRAGTDANG
jgi:hypothetical protein